MKFVLLLFLLLAPASVVAQELPIGDPRNEEFREHFQEIVAINNDISDFHGMPPGTEYRLPNGDKEVLRVGDAKGIWGREFEKMYGTPYEEFLATGQVKVQESTMAPVFVQAAEQPVESRFSWWWLLVAVATLATIGRLVWRRLADPVNSGPPIRQGGINDSSAPDHFREMASERTGPIGGAAYVSPERIRVINIRRGRGYGLMRVRYQGGREETKRLSGEVVYQATVEFPDGRQEVMYCLQGCANDLVYLGSRYIADRLFRFEPEGASVYAPPTETIVRSGSTEVQITDGELTISSGGRTIAFGAENWTLQKNPDGGFLVTDEGYTGVVFRNGQVYGTKLPKATVVDTGSPGGQAEEREPATASRTMA